MKKPSVFGKYLLLERLNVGGMAEVFAAKAFGVEGFERILAIKKILPTMIEDQEFITMFIDEARISVQLNHANVVHIHELGKHEEDYYIAMEYVSGKDLRSLVERFRRRGELMPTAMAVFVTSKICEGLDYAHRKKDARGIDLNIIHRDVSPQNILISYEGEVKIIDFGIAKAANRSQSTQAGILKGKFGYMSPEQVRGMSIDRRSDVFAVGVILYELLTGEKLFVGESDFSTLEKVRNAEVPAPRQFNPNIPAGLEKVVCKALAREPEDRYQWGSDLQEDLMRFLLSGDAIYSAKHLAGFMKDAFAEDLLREAEKMERFSQVERPEQLEQTGAPLRRKSAGPLPAVNKRSPSSGQISAQSGAGAVATGLQAAPHELPSPEEWQPDIADRTVIVPASTPDDADSKTAIGLSPIPSTSNNRAPRGAKNTGNRTTAEALAAVSSTVGEATMAPAVVPPVRSLSDGLADSDADLAPIEATGFRPAADFLAPEAKKPKPKIVIGDAPVNGATTIGPSPLSSVDGSLTRDQPLSDSSRDVRPLTHDMPSVESLSGQYEAPSDVSALPDDDDEGDDEEASAPPPRAASAPARTKRPQPATDRSKTALLALLTALVMAVVAGIGVLAHRMLGPSKERVLLKVTPANVGFTVRVDPGGQTQSKPKTIELAPGSYTLLITPDPGFQPTKALVTVAHGATPPVLVNLVRVNTAVPRPTVSPSSPANLASGAGGSASEPKKPTAYSLTLKTKHSGRLKVKVGTADVDDVTAEAPFQSDAIGFGTSISASLDGFESLVDVDPNPDRLSKRVFELDLKRKAKVPEPQKPAEAALKTKPEVERPPPRPRPEPVVAKMPEPKSVEPKPVTAVAAPVVVRAKGKLRVVSTVAGAVVQGAEVFVDGKNTGKKTPMVATNELELAAGEHKVTVKLQGKVFETRVTISEGEATPVRAALE
jgi:eukaryotic-like serine/threonine-protein kinase